MENRWLRIGGTLLFGLFVAYLDRTNLSVGLPSMAKDMGFSGAGFAITASWALTAFLIGYAVSNFFGGMLTQRFSPKGVVITLFAIWSVVTILTGWVASIALLVVYRVILGITEGVYWPQQSRFAWMSFKPGELTRANSLIQYYGQYASLAIGFMVLTPLYHALGWHSLFFITGAAGLIIVIPLYWKFLTGKQKAQTPQAAPAPRERITFEAMGGSKILLVIFAYLTNGMLFWGITLWIPMVVRSLGYHGASQGWASALPFILAVVLAIPAAYLSDKAQKRELIAAGGIVVAGIMLILLPELNSAAAKLWFIAIAMGVYASCFTPNIWAIIQSTVRPQAIGATAGIVNGIGAGGGGTIAGLLVGMLYAHFNSYLPGFLVLGILAILGGVSLIIYGQIAHSRARDYLGSPSPA